MSSRTCASGWASSLSADSIVFATRSSANGLAGSPNFGFSFLSASNFSICEVGSRFDPLYSTLVRNGNSGTQNVSRKCSEVLLALPGVSAIGSRSARTVSNHPVRANACTSRFSFEVSNASPVRDAILTFKVSGEIRRKPVNLISSTVAPLFATSAAPTTGRARPRFRFCARSVAASSDTTTLIVTIQRLSTAPLHQGTDALTDGVYHHLGCTPEQAPRCDNLQRPSRLGFLSTATVVTLLASHERSIQTGRPKSTPCKIAPHRGTPPCKVGQPFLAVRRANCVSSSMCDDLFIVNSKSCRSARATT